MGFFKAIKKRMLDNKRPANIKPMSKDDWNFMKILEEKRKNGDENI